jgi:hypothetical protein
MKTKLCSRCGRQRPLEDFPTHAAGKRGVGRRFLCVDHWPEYCAEQRDKHREKNKAYWRDRYKNDPGYKAMVKARAKQDGETRRLLVLQHYGGEHPRCACCSEGALEFLCLDHVAGGGTKHRDQVRREGKAMTRWIIDNNFPKMFRVLCHNCNTSLGHYGYCPHKKKDLP